MNQITINEPCHENWAAMTPTQQGAFCGKCQIDVVDFSNKSPLEIKQILTENSGKHLCGRFKKTQLEELNERFVDWENQSPQIFQSKFLYACLLVFGMALFNVNAQEEMMLGQITVNQIENSVPADSLNKKSDQRKEQNKKEDVEQNFKKGKVAYNYIEEDENNFIKGDIAYIPDTTELVKETICEAIESDTTLNTEIQKTEPENPELDSSEPEIPEPEELVSSDFMIGVYPNPTSFEGTVSLKIFKADIYTIDLMDLNGKIITQIHAGFFAKVKTFFR
ncbi:MAG: hypothetical protein IPM77_10355 [Crocinitomicaceae bacterium]|nr:hypothetical protein [Crocinitomicaceae bacterium]